MRYTGRMNDKNNANVKKKKIHQCAICGKKFKALRSRNLHKKTHYTSYECKICSKQFTRLTSLRKHMQLPHKTHSTSLYECRICGKHYKQSFFLKNHTRIAHINNQRGGRQSSSSGSTNVASRSTQTAINNRVQIKTFVPHGNNR